MAKEITARGQEKTAFKLIGEVFGAKAEGLSDALFLDSGFGRALGLAGAGIRAPILRECLKYPEFAELFGELGEGSHLINVSGAGVSVIDSRGGEAAIAAGTAKIVSEISAAAIIRSASVTE